MRAFVVVLVDELVEQVLQVGQGGRLVGWPAGGVAGSARLWVCWNRATFPQVVGWLGREFFWTTPRAASSASNALRPPRTRPEACRTVYTIPLSVNVEAGQPYPPDRVERVALAAAVTNQLAQPTTTGL